MELEDLAIQYDEFRTPYADVTIILKDKPEEILTAIENSFSHLMQYLSRDLDLDVREKNLVKAHNHLVRATLDSHKILWIVNDNKIQEVWNDDDMRAYCFKDIPQHDLPNLYSEYVTLSKQARESELRNVGIDTSESISMWKEANNKGKELVDCIDEQCLLRVIRQRKRWKLKDIGVGILIGVIGSIIASAIWCTMF